MKRYYILDNVLNKTENFKIYNYLVRTPMWHLSRFSFAPNDFESSINNFPGMNIEQ